MSVLSFLFGMSMLVFLIFEKNQETRILLPNELKTAEPINDIRLTVGMSVNNV